MRKLLYPWKALGRIILDTVALLLPGDPLLMYQATRSKLAPGEHLENFDCTCIYRYLPCLYSLLPPYKQRAYPIQVIHKMSHQPHKCGHTSLEECLHAGGFGPHCRSRKLASAHPQSNPNLKEWKWAGGHEEGGKSSYSGVNLYAPQEYASPKFIPPRFWIWKWPGDQVTPVAQPDETPSPRTCTKGPEKNS